MGWDGMVQGGFFFFFFRSLALGVLWGHGMALMWDGMGCFYFWGMGFDLF